jgi:biotin transporter BioY
MSHLSAKKFSNHFLQLLVGSILILICGGIGLFWHIPADQIFIQGISPFLPGALIKILVGAILLSVFHKVRFILSN